MRNIFFAIFLGTFPLWGQTDTSSLFDIARSGDTAAFTRWQRKHPNYNIDTTDASGHTPVILATYHKQLVFLDYLLRQGKRPDLDRQDRAGNTALMGAAYKGYDAIAQWLVEKGANIHVLNYNQASALTFCATFNRLALARLLLEKGARMDIKDTFGQTPLDYAEGQDNDSIVTLLKAAAP